MEAPTIPANEEARLRALDRYQVLDTPREKAFDDLTWLARKIADTPIALVSLIDRERQWFKSKQGLGACETHRNISFCGHAIHRKGPFVVSNALEDNRFSDNPLVTRAPHIRFYTGFPLTTPDGFNLGTLCVIDREPRKLAPEQMKMLSVVATQVVNQLELRLTGQRMREAALEASLANQSKSQFLANMSHEIRTPMNAVLGLTELVLDSKLSGEQRNHLSIVRDSAHLLIRLLNDILDFSKIEAGKLDLECIPFSPVERVEMVVKTLAVHAARKGLSLSFKADPEVPDQLLGDPVRLEQILFNLIGNAVKFTEKGEVMVSLDWESDSEEKNQLGVSVRDTGIGISEEKRKLVFEAFTQADGSTSRLYGGTGLGLAIVSRLVRMLNGRIKLESALGQGSTFRFSIPCAAFSGPSPQESEKQHREFQGRRVLIVSGSAMDRVILQTAFRCWGLNAVCVVDGSTAIEEVIHAEGAESPFELVLLGDELCDWSGREVAERILRRIAGPPPVLAMLTTEKQAELLSEKPLPGIQAYVAQPMHCLSVPTLVRELLPSAEAANSGGNPRFFEAQRPPALLVEDNPTNRILTERLLERMGFGVETVTNGAGALEAVEEKRYELILMDIQMPGMDGYQTTEAIRAREVSAADASPIVALTGHALKGDRERCLECGMNGYLSKPFTRDEFVRVITEVSIYGHVLE